MMKAAQYGHIIKHLETGHLNALPLISVDTLLRAEFERQANDIIEKRNRAYALTIEGERLFEEAFGEFTPTDFGERGFVAKASQVFGSPRRRLDAWHYNPSVKAIHKHLSKRATAWSLLHELQFKVWLPTRFRRVNAGDGVVFLDSSDLFETNPDLTKRIADTDFGDRYRGRVEQGWILLSRSGQIYGLNGSAMICGHCHENKVVSDHIIRIAPDRPQCRVGYLLIVITHPKLGRPRIKSLPYGSSIPEIEVFDAERFPVPRLDSGTEDRIADCAEGAARLRDEADAIEMQMERRADSIVASFLMRKSA